ncbi:MAG: aldehyde ferredoxin oxidoreductase family protein [Candidatus Bathyarchaeota archaeon]|nr:aldehyde ferredoxin oxidoreductase family protein [Candidatus Bathyarchaeota archaeon]
MFEYGGYAGKFLRLNLTDKKATTLPLTKEMARMLIGGNGFAVKILYDELKAGIDPLGPENKVVFANGPIQGTIIPTAGRNVVASKSPATGGFFDSYGGGCFGPELKYAGYDGIIVEGQAKEPTYVTVNDDDIEFKDASHLWGKMTFETQEILRKEIGDPKIQITCIGPGGEKLVKFAAVIWGARAAGRGGVGAVLGSKKLKAISVRGSQDVNVPDIDAFEKYLTELYGKIISNPGTGQALPKLGTPGVTTVQNQLGILGTNNWQTEVFDKAEKISGDVMRKNMVVRDRGCFACPIRCTKMSYVRDGPYAGTFDEGPEYETIFAFGSMCGIPSLEAIAKADLLSDEYGIDTISAGAVTAFAMECYKEGILSKDDVDGIDMTFGNDSALIEMIHKIGKREGIGDLMAEGTDRAAIKIGKGAEKFSSAIKGLEMAGHSPRGMKGFGIGVATGTRGGSHQDARPTGERIGKSPTDRFTTEGKPAYAIGTQHTTTMQDAMCVCRMTEGIYGLWEISVEHLNTINIVTGMNLSLEELALCAERIVNLERAFNCREGMNRESDVLSIRFMTEPIPEGPSKGMYYPSGELEKLKDEYYEIRGWDKKTGVPTKQKFEELGLNQEAKDFYK